MCPGLFRIVSKILFSRMFPDDVPELWCVPWVLYCPEEDDMPMPMFMFMLPLIPEGYLRSSQNVSAELSVSLKVSTHSFYLWNVEV